MQLISDQLLDGRFLDYVAGSYCVVGNEDTTPVGGKIAASPTLSASVVAALDAFSDHLPVLASYAYRIAGDATGDDSVDFNDFLALQANFGAAGSNYDRGDFDYDGSTNFNDFLILQSNFGNSIAGATAISAADRRMLADFAAAVLEPATALIISAAMLFAAGRRRVR